MGTYIQVLPVPQTQLLLNTIMDDLHIPLDIRSKELHCTVMYAADTKSSTYMPRPELVYSGEVIGAELLGEGEKKALAIKFKCPSLVRRFNYMTSTGLKHSFPTLLPHVTLAYGENVSEIMERLTAYLERSPQLRLQFSDESVSPL